jgi:hypothetical protein
MHRVFLLAMMVPPAPAQQFGLGDYLRLAGEAPGTSMSEKVKSLDSLGITLSQPGMRQLSTASDKLASSPRYQPTALAQQFDLGDYLRLAGEAPGASMSEKVKWLDSLGITLSERGMRQLSAASDKPGSSPRHQPAAPSARRRTSRSALRGASLPGYQPAASSYPLPARVAPGIQVDPSQVQPVPSYPLPAPVAPVAPFGAPQLRSSDSQRRNLGNLNPNPYDPNSISNPYGQYGSPYSPKSVNNPYGVYGSPYSPYSATNPYATQAPAIVAPNGQYLGRFSSNPYDPDSTSNPYGQYGSPYSPKSVNNPYGMYGSPYSPYGATNPFSFGQSTPNLLTLPSMPALPPLPALPSLPPLPSLPSLPPLPKY